MARLFGRGKQAGSEHPVPAELESYYERNGWRKWVRYVVIGAITIALLFALFLLARAVYRSVADTGNNEVGKPSQNESNGASKSKEGSKPQKQQSGSQSGSSSQGQSDSESTSQDKTHNSTNTNPTTVPRTGDDPSDLPSTGDNPTDQPPTTLPSTGG